MNSGPGSVVDYGRFLSPNIFAGIDQRVGSQTPILERSKVYHYTESALRGKVKNYVDAAYTWGSSGYQLRGSVTVIGKDAYQLQGTIRPFEEDFDFKINAWYEAPAKWAAEKITDYLAGKPGTAFKISFLDEFNQRIGTGKTVNAVFTTADLQLADRLRTEGLDWLDAMPPSIPDQGQTYRQAENVSMQNLARYEAQQRADTQQRHTLDARDQRSANADLADARESRTLGARDDAREARDRAASRAAQLENFHDKIDARQVEKTNPTSGAKQQLTGMQPSERTMAERTRRENIERAKQQDRRFNTVTPSITPSIENHYGGTSFQGSWANDPNMPTFDPNHASGGLTPGFQAAPAVTQPKPAPRPVVAIPVARPPQYLALPKIGPIPAQKPAAPSTVAGFFGGLVGAIGGVIGGIAGIVGGIFGAIGEVIGGIFGGGSSSPSNKGAGHGSDSGGRNSGASKGMGAATRESTRNEDHKSQWGRPVLLDLSGNGLTVDALSSSSQFVDLNGDGYLHRTAWAGEGTGVLIIDTNGDGKINQSNEFIFTEWDKSATGDLEAIRNVFDTNHNGKLDAGDARWAEFKVMVNGQMQSLDALGIASIDLTPKGSGQNFADGSAIVGRTEFTRTDGTTGTVGDAVLASDPNGYIVKRTSVTYADGSTTEDILAYNKDGSLAFRNLITRSADGLTKTTQFDDDGNGTFDRSQIEVLRLAGLLTGDPSAIEGTPGDDYIAGTDGNDTIRGGSGNDTFYGKAGSDILIGGGGTNQADYDGSAVDYTFTRNADGTVTVAHATNGVDTLIDIDAVWFYGENQWYSLDDLAPHGTGTRVSVGTAGDDYLAGTDGNDILRGGDGNDTLFGGHGNDVIKGGGGSYNQADYDGVAADYTFTRNADGTVTVAHATNGVDTLSEINGLWFNGEEKWYSLDELAPLNSGETVSVGTGNGNYFGGTDYADRINFTGGSGNYVDAGGGSDTVVFAGDVTAYRILGEGDRFTVTHAATGDSVQFTNVEFIKFAGAPALSLVDIVANSGHVPGATWSEPQIIDKSRTRTISNFNADGSLLNRTTIVTSADRKTITTTVDQDGDGLADQSETFVTNADGSTVTTTRAFSLDGSLSKQINVTASADGLSKTTRTDANGDGVYELNTIEMTIIDADGGRTRTVDSKSADGTLIATTITRTSADNRTRTVQYDHSGNGTFDESETTSIAVDGSGQITTTVSSFNADQSLRDKTITVTSADGLSQTTSSDLTGDGVVDRVTSQVTVVGADTSRTQTEEVWSADGTLLAKSITTTSGDGKTITVDEDQNGDGAWDSRTTVIVNADGSTTQTVMGLNPDGSLLSKAIAVTTADGLSTTTSSDLNGDGTIDRTETDVTTVNADGSRTQTVVAKNADVSIISRTVKTTSADSLTQTVEQDLNGDGLIDQVVSTVIVLNADGSRQQTTTTRSGDGALLGKTVTLTSTDRKTTTVTTDSDGDGNVDQTAIQVLNADGSKTATITRTNSVGALLAKSVTTTSANGLDVTTTDDVDGDGSIDKKTVDLTVLNANGSRTRTVTTTSGNGALISETVTKVSANGLVKTVDVNVDGSGPVDAKTTETSIFNADGSITKTVSNYAGTSLKDRTVTTVSANGLNSSAQIDADGNGTVDRIATSSKTLNTDGSTVETIETRSVSGTLLAKSVRNTSANGRNISVDEDVNGDGAIDTRRTVLVNADGSTTETVREFNPNGTLVAKSVTDTSANGLSKTIHSDLNGDGTDDAVTTDVMSLNADGSRAQTVASRSSDGTLLGTATTTTSANGLTRTLEKDITGDGVVDEVTTSAVIINADGSRQEMAETRSGNDTLLGKTVTLTSADRRTTTITTDDNGDGEVDQTIVEVLNVDGSRTRTVTRTNADGTIYARSISTTSASGLTVTTWNDVNGDGVIDEKIVDTTILNADGSRTQTVTTTSSDGTLLDKTVTTIFTNGLVISVDTDLNGDGSVDTTVWDATVLNADGSVTKTVSEVAGSALIDRTITTVSANGLTSIVQSDLDGNGTVDATATTTKALNADGSTVETLSTINASGNLISKSVTTVSANANSTSLDDDINGDGVVDRHETRVVNADGSTTQTVDQYKANGSLMSRSVTETSADGLSTITRIDSSGDGVFDLSTNDTTVLNADGSRTRSIVELGANDTPAWRTTVVVSANGLTKATTWALGTGATLRSMSEVSVLNADGSTIQTVSYNKANGTLESNTTTTLSADKRTTTVVKDIDGDGKTNQQALTVENADGSTVQTLTDYGPDGTTVIGKKAITTSADSLSETIDYDIDGNGTIDTRTTRTVVLNPNGSKTETLSTFGSGGLVLKGKTVADTSADGLTVATKWDTTGTGSFNRTETDATVLNTDGSRTRTISIFAAGVLTKRQLIGTSANGLSVTTQWDTIGSGTYDQKATDVTTINSDGSRTRTVANTKSDGTVLSWSVETTSADGRTVTVQDERAGLGQRTRKIVRDILADGSIVDTVLTTDASGNATDWTVTSSLADGRYVTIERETNGDDNVDQKEERIQAVDGSLTTTITGFRADHGVANRTTAKVSADGLTTTTEWDLDGEGTIDRRRTTTNTFNVDGSQRSVTSDTDETGKLVSRTTIVRNADGTTRTTSRDVNGSGTVDQVETVTVDLSGASITTVTNSAEARELSNLVAGEVYWAKAIAAKVETTVSTDGLMATVRSDFDGNGTFEHVMVSKTQIDGSIVSTITETNADGSVKAKGTITTSADGLVTVLNKDANNDGTYDRTETAVTRNDGSITLTAVDRNTNGSLKETVTESFTAAGKLLSSLTTDSAGRKTAEIMLNVDGTTTAKTFAAAGGQQLSVSQLNTKGILTSATLYDPLNANPWSRVEQSFDAAGKKTLEKQFNDDGIRADITFDAASGQQKQVNFYSATNVLTGTTTYDWTSVNPWTRMERSYNAAGQITYQNEFQDNGTRTAYTYDPANAQAWTQIVQSFDTANRLTYQNQFNDNGTRSAITLDPTNAQPWSRVDQNFDTANRLTYQLNSNDDGTKTAYTWDATNAQTWSYIVQLLDTTGSLTTQYNIYDNSTQIHIVYDPHNIATWSNIQYHFNAAGQLLLDMPTFDNGTRTETYFDPTNAQTWSRIVRTFNSAGTPVTETQYYDDGRRIELSNYSNGRFHLGMRYASNGNFEGKTEYYDNGGYKVWRLTYSWTEYNASGQVIGHWSHMTDKDPILLDLNGDNHIDLRPFDPQEFADDTGPKYDWDEDGIRDGTAWVGPQDGFLAIDLGSDGAAGADGLIDQARELAFSMWPEGITEGDEPTDLEALRLVFDTNHDDVLDSNDARWNEFRVWQDLNQNGISDQGELKTMSEAGIRLVNLLPSSQGATQFPDGSAITGTSSYEMTDGTTRLVGDATLAFASSVRASNPA
ncbi:hypothetical protein B5P45_00035 [Phyllobacterium zundukense]|uniref:Uncharacterized protein n=2 Tax=Phyllobacterium zundukense TaxID=1867719 RepID=A0A2N9W558_9HYPH|nr:hypothetical protein BLM14_21080 [Phyllobacterium zundukense]PIO46876.1 hypothetical protein B5P45_00035 [Phyllobacterium zundukense]